MEDDVMTPSQRKEYEEYVLRSLREAGADSNLLNASTTLDNLDQDILEDATRQLRYDFDASFKQNSKMTISSLAEELWKAVQSR